MFNKKPFMYRFRMYLFGQKYSAKELWIMRVAIIMYGIGSGWAIPFIIENIMGLSLDSKAESFYDALSLIFYCAFYFVISYTIFYHISKFIVETILYIFSLIKAKLQ